MQTVYWRYSPLWHHRSSETSDVGLYGREGFEDIKKKGSCGNRDTCLELGEPAS